MLRERHRDSKVTDKYYLVSGRGTQKGSSVTERERETGYQVIPCRERAAERLQRYRKLERHRTSIYTEEDT
jgi:hypothetical protein